MNNNIQLALLNAQSIKNKDIDIKEYLSEKKVDIAVITETWIQETDADIWVEGCELNKDNFRVSTSNRTTRKGGGLAIVYKQDRIVKKESEGNLNTFQFTKWRVTSSSNKKHLNIIAIYRPLYSTANPQTIASFLDEFTNWLPDQLVENDNVLILGAFNIHINDQTDEDAGIFTDTMEVLGLSQHVEHPTHRLGNTLDLIFTETNGNTQLDSIREGPFFSDHSAVTFKLWFPEMT